MTGVAGERELLVRLGCEGLQGYYLHRPLDVVQARTLLEGQHRRH